MYLLATFPLFPEESRKKVLFLVARPLRPYPLELSGHIFWGNSFFRDSKKVAELFCSFPYTVFTIHRTPRGLISV